MNGILNILKPPGMTSFDVVAHVRGLTGTRKIGHAGTLDPLAAGVLTVCAGSATGAIEFMADKDKLYRAELTLGVSTDTQDSTGAVLTQKPVKCSDEEIIKAAGSFTGGYDQLPPMYSALKRNGRKLYELAREGVDVERTPRRIEIYSIEVIRIIRQESPEESSYGKISMLFDVHCSKGTYIRTLCADIGERLGCGGHMSFLLRKRAGVFCIDNALTLEELKELAACGRLQDAVMEAEAAFSGMGAVRLDPSSEKKFRNGVRFEIDQPPTESGLVRVYGTDGRFLALGELYDSGGRKVLKSRKFFTSDLGA